jgi:polyisoprenoid-binding protein YceI
MSQPRFPARPRRLAAVLFAAAMAFGSAAFAGDSYMLDKTHTEIRFSWSHLGVSRMSGTILDYQGKLDFDAAAPERSSFAFTARTDSLWTHVAALDDILKGPDFFNAGKFPEIGFKSTKVEKTGEKTGRITGDLTIKGVTRPVTLDVRLNFKGLYPYLNKPALGFSASTTINRSDFGIDKGVPAVSDEIRISIETEMQQG